MTGDYLAFTQVDALWQLLGWSQLDVSGEDDVAPRPGKLHVRLVRTVPAANGAERAFHPKAWLFESATAGAAFVGSNNLTRSALETGVEWNLRRARDRSRRLRLRARRRHTLWAAAADLTRRGSKVAIADGVFVRVDDEQMLAEIRFSNVHGASNDPS